MLCNSGYRVYCIAVCFGNHLKLSNETTKRWVEIRMGNRPYFYEEVI